MKYLIRLAGYVLKHSPAFYEGKRQRLAQRMKRIHFMDELEGSLDVMVRGYFAYK